MDYLIILNFLTAIVALVVLCRKRHFLFALVALFCTILYGYGIWHAGIHIDDELCQMLHDQETYGREKAYPTALGGWTALMLSNVCLAIYPWLKRWAVVLWMLLIAGIGIAVSIFSSLSIIEGLFAMCCAIMCEMTIMTGLTYLEFTVLENIYLHSLLPTVFALPALYVCVRSLRRGHQHSYLSLLLSGTWFVLNLLMTVVIWQHYIHLPLEGAGRLCVGELKAMSGNTWSGYVTVNILIFVIAFLIDIIISWLLYRYAKTSIQRQKNNNENEEKD